MSQEIDARCNSVIERGLIHGAIFSATNAAGTFTYTRALGQRTLRTGDKTPQRIDDVVCLAGGTNLVTTIAALQCVQDGLFSLADNVSPWAPELAAKQVLVGHTKMADGREPILEDATSKITLEMLLTHTSGVVFDFVNPDVGRWRRTFAPQDLEAQTSVEDTYNYPLGFQPGEAWMLGPGLDWVGRIIERATGKALGDFVQERIFAPLGISDAQFYPVTREDLQQRQIDRNPQDPEGYGSAALGMGGTMNKNSRGHFGGHGLFITAPAFTKVLQSLLANDGTLLPPAVVDDMFADHLRGKAKESISQVLTGSLGPHIRPDPMVESKTGHGLGGMLSLEDLDVGYGEGTMGWTAAMPVIWFIDRKNDLCGFGSIQATLEPGGTSRVQGLKMGFQKQIYVEYNAWKESQERSV